jgi:ribosomal protein S7
MRELKEYTFVRVKRSTWLLLNKILLEVTETEGKKVFADDIVSRALELYERELAEKKKASTKEAVAKQ